MQRLLLWSKYYLRRDQVKNPPLLVLLYVLRLQIFVVIRHVGDIV